MPRLLHIVAATGGGCDQYIERLRRLEGYPAEVLALSATLSPVRAGLSIGAALPRTARHARRADLLHAHGEVAAIAVLPLLANRPSIVTTHGLHLLRRLSGSRLDMARRAFEQVVRRAARTICTSKAEQDELRSLLDPAAAARLTVVRNGVELPSPDQARRDEARAELHLKPDDVAVLYLGRLEPRKDPLSALRAAQAARARGAPLVLVVAGDGPLREEMTAQAVAGGDGVRMLGFRDDVESLLGACDVFVMPSAREGSSLAVLEAMSHGLPTVVSDGAGNPEAVGEAGVVVPFGDVSALADALEQLVREPHTRKRLGAAARERVAHDFSLESFLAETRRVYEEALGKATPSAGADQGA
jgi:glycosyltransferase involved in cell wall biosynthesis